MVKVLLILLALVVIVGSILLRKKEKGIALAIVIVLFSFVGDVLSDVTADMIKPLLYESGETDKKEPEAEAASRLDNVQYTSGDMTPAPEPMPTPETVETEPVDLLRGLTDISEQTSVSGSVIQDGDLDQYLYTATVSGVYRFASGQDYGRLKVQIDNKYGGEIASGDSGINAELEAGKTYILKVEYTQYPLDYTIQIGVPNPVTDITGQTFVSGNLTYFKQKDIYTYTAPFSGVYLFDSGRMFGALNMQVNNPQGEKISIGSAAVEAALEAGNTYTLVVEETNNLIDYTIQIYTPQPIIDVTTQSTASGTLTYYCQQDQYLYTVPEDGAYVFETDASVYLKLRDADGKELKRDFEKLTISLEGGKNYILVVYQEYSTLPLMYMITIRPE